MAEVPAQRIALLVSELARRFGGYLESQASALDLTAPQAALIRHLDRPLPMKDVAGRLHCDASNVTGIVDRLESRGLVERRVRTGDRRVKELVLTPEGRRVQRRVTAIAKRLSGLTLSESEQRQLIRLLEKATSAVPPSG
jgi:DNA-binding MarR family transcriptional regulator